MIFVGNVIVGAKILGNLVNATISNELSNDIIELELWDLED